MTAIHGQNTDEDRHEKYKDMGSQELSIGEEWTITVTTLMMQL